MGQLQVSLKKTLFRVLGQEGFLRLLNKGFHWAYRMGALRQNPSYAYHYFVARLIQPTDTVVDIGANLGYYAGIFARLTQAGGKLVCIEPVQPFFQILQKNLAGFPHVTLYNCALGTEEKTITMTIPKQYGYLRTGLASVAQGEANPADYFTFSADMRRASVLLSGLSTIDYIKCDVEGFEKIILPEMREIFANKRPLLQVELSTDTISLVFDLMKGLHYERYHLHQGKLVKDLPVQECFGDFLFVPAEKSQKIQEALA